MSRQTVQASIVINAPVDFVWEVINDPATYAEGIAWVYEAWREDDGPLRLGSVYVERAKPGLRDFACSSKPFFVQTGGNE